MSLASLAKIPCLLSVAGSVIVAATPPTAPPKKTEVIRPTVMEYLRTRISPLFAQSLVTIFSSTECLVILEGVLKWPTRGRLASSLVFGDPGAARLAFTPSFLASAALIVGGALVRLQCYRALGKFFTFEVAIRTDHRLVTSGPYAYCRHPGYLGAVACYAGISLWLMSAGGWARESGLLSTVPGRVILLTFVGQTLFTLTGLLARMQQEDALLRKEFGKEWDEWAERVPYLLVPGLY